MKAYIHGKSLQDDGSLSSLWTVTVEVKQALLDWQKRGLSYTRRGYGSKIPTEYMVKFQGRWRRVYCCIFSNSGTLYIGNFGKKSIEIMIVQIDAAEAQS